MEKNLEKYEIYRMMNINLAKALKSDFYYQAIFIEYAIIEDRCLSVLKHAGVKYLDSKGHVISLDKKLNKMESNEKFTVPVVRNKITMELINDIRNWKNERNKLIHNLANIPYDNETIMNIAIEGQRIIKVLNSKVNSVNKYYEKRDV